MPGKDASVGQLQSTTKTHAPAAGSHVGKNHESVIGLPEPVAAAATMLTDERHACCARVLIPPCVPLSPYAHAHAHMRTPEPWRAHAFAHMRGGWVQVMTATRAIRRASTRC